MCTPEEMLWKKRRQVEKSEEMFVRPQQKKKKKKKKRERDMGKQQADKKAETKSRECYLS